MGFLFGSSSSTNAETATAAKGLTVQTSCYGVVIPVIYGTVRTSGNLIWYGDFQAIYQSETVGKGGGSQEQGSYKYKTCFAIAICEGPIYGFGYYWENKKRAFHYEYPFVIFSGTYGQLPWQYLWDNHQLEAMPYSGIAYLGALNYDLGEESSLPTINIEVRAMLAWQSDDAADSDPAMFLYDLLTNSVYGAGFSSSFVTDWRSGSSPDGYSSYGNFCRTFNLFMSLLLDSQRSAAEVVTEVCKLTTSTPMWNGVKLNIIPYGTNSYTRGANYYEARTSAVYDLGHNDFLWDGGSSGPVQIKRKRPADCFNVVELECVDRSNDYETAVVDARNDADIQQYGRLSEGTQSAHHFANLVCAKNAADLMLNRELIRNTFCFTLGWRYILLEPMDLVTLTDSILGLDHVYARITLIEEDDNGNLTVEAEEFQNGNGLPGWANWSPAQGYNQDYNVDPGALWSPTFCEPSVQFTGRGLELWIALSGQGEMYGGCEVWMSMDNATYGYMGKILGSNRNGCTASALPMSTTNPDQTNVLQVQISPYHAELLSTSQDNAKAGDTVCWVDGELLSFANASPLGGGVYNLSYLVRGQYNSENKAHAALTAFARLDNAVFRYQIPEDRVGKPVYFKFVAFNIFGGGRQSLDEVPVYTHTLQGLAYFYDLPDITSLSSSFVDGFLQLTWKGIDDFRTPIDYEVRFGSAWETSQYLGRTPTTIFPVTNIGLYWVAAHYMTKSGYHVYSATPQSVAIATAGLVRNVVQSWGEDPDWTGTCGGDLIKWGDVLQLQGAGDMLSATDVLAIDDILFYGQVADSGSYTIPTGHQVEVGVKTTAGDLYQCRVFLAVTGYATGIYDDLLSAPDVLSMTDILNGSLAPYISIKPQIRFADKDGDWGDWFDYSPGVYLGKTFDARVLVATTDPTVEAVVTGMTFTVDVPDLIDQGTNVAIAAGGTSITFGQNFHAVPNIQVTILSATAGDDVVISATSQTGFTIRVWNGGSGVARNINWIAQGY